MCILSVGLYTLLKVVCYYDFSALSMTVMGFQKKSLDGGGVGGWGELHPICFGIFAKPLSGIIRSVICYPLLYLFALLHLISNACSPHSLLHSESRFPSHRQNKALE